MNELGIVRRAQNRAAVYPDAPGGVATAFRREGFSYEEVEESGVEWIAALRVNAGPIFPWYWRRWRRERFLTWMLAAFMSALMTGYELRRIREEQARSPSPQNDLLAAREKGEAAGLTGTDLYSAVLDESVILQYREVLPRLQEVADTTLDPASVYVGSILASQDRMIAESYLSDPGIRALLARLREEV